MAGILLLCSLIPLKLGRSASGHSFRLEPHVDTIINCLHIYFVIAVAYNVLSQLSADFFDKPFAPTDPKTGIMTVTVVYLIFMLRDVIPLNSVLFLLAVFTFLIGRYGVLHHSINYKKDAYLSRLTWLSAMVINVFGVVYLTVFIIGNLA